MKLDTPAKMTEALGKALKMGWRGFVEACHDRNGAEVWVIELNGPDEQQIAAELGETLTFKDGRITK